MAEGEDKGLSIPRLTRKNYNGWKARVKADLLAKGIWEAIVGYATEPDVADQAERTRRHKNNLTALSVIMRTVSDDLINDIADVELADEAWTLLDKICNENSLYGATVKLRELTSLVKTDDISIQEYCNKITNMNRQLEKNDLGFNTKQLAAICLTGLPKEKYQITIKTLIANPDNLEMSIVKQHLLEEEEENGGVAESAGKSHQVLRTEKREPSKRTNQKKGTSWRSQADGDKPNFKNRYPDSEKKVDRSNRRYFCYCCGDESHLAADCPKAKESAAKKASASVATREHISLCARKDVPSNDGTWLLDCSASDHMTSRRDLMKDFKASGGEVELGDGAPLKILGIGSVVIHMSEE